MGDSSGFITGLIVLLVLGGFGFLLYQNAQPAEPVRVVIPTQAPPTQNPDALAEIFSSGFGSNTTPLPTVAIPAAQFVAPTIPPAPETDSEPISAEQITGGQPPTAGAPISLPATPTRIPPTPTIAVGDDGVEIAMVNVQDERPADNWRPPSMPVPQSRDPLGRDHYIFARPIDSNATDFGLFYYPYGTGELPLAGLSRVHHGIDMSNPIGTPVRAAGSGTVLFSSVDEQDLYPGSAGYGIVIVIEHDFTWNGQYLWTLYAHLDQTLVRPGERVEMGQVIALSGNTGRSSGPHLHFEVRMGRELPLGYGDTQNPVLWMAPYYGHGTLAGRFVSERGNFIDAQPVTVRSLATGRTYTTSTYTFDGTINQISNDPLWDENFVIGDLPQGRYVVSVEHEGVRLSETVDIFEGMTSLVELSPVTIATPQPVTPQAQSDDAP
ncbi:MAG: hypothetical protein EA396_04050 [Anaerolineaceae bacterium]|nr:MAG: hypothetical protein EA396_04050 [Anaerolineaceae bacterium]